MSFKDKDKFSPPKSDHQTVNPFQNARTEAQLQCDYSNRDHPTKFSTNLTNKIRGGNNSLQQIILVIKLYNRRQQKL